MCALIEVYVLGMHAIELCMISRVRQANSMSFQQTGFTSMSKV